MLSLTAKLAILIVDDHSVVRRGYMEIIANEPDMLVVGEASNTVEGIAALRELQPDFAIVDICFPEGNGIDFIRQIKTIHEKTKILVVSMFDPAIYA